MSNYNFEDNNKDDIKMMFAYFIIIVGIFFAVTLLTGCSINSNYIDLDNKRCICKDGFSPSVELINDKYECKCR